MQTRSRSSKATHVSSSQMASALLAQSACCRPCASNRWMRRCAMSREVLMPDKTAHEQQSEQSLIVQAGQINHDGRNTVDAADHAVKKTAVREENDSRHLDLLKLPAKVVVKYIIYFVALWAVYALDV